MNFENLSKLRTAVYPLNMARIGTKLWQNTFQTICNFSFFDAEFFFFGFFFAKIFGADFFFKKLEFWRSYDFLIRVGRCVVPSHCPKCPYFWGDFLGGGVNDSICVENVDLAWKMTSTIWCLRFGDNMITWYHDWNARGVTTFSVYLCVLSKKFKK